MIFGWVLAIVGAGMALLVGPSAKRPDGRLWPAGWAAIIVGVVAFVAGTTIAIVGA